MRLEIFNVLGLQQIKVTTYKIFNSFADLIPKSTDTTRGYLRSIKRMAEDRHARLLIVYIPERQQPADGCGSVEENHGVLQVR